MLEQLPELIDPLQCAEKRRSFKGEIALSALPRLVDALAETSGHVAFSLAFDKQGSRAVVEGHLCATLLLTCQNCLHSLAWPVEIDFHLGIVTSPDEANLLPEAYEPLLVGEDKIPLRDIVEEELLLSLPAFPKHTEGDCFHKKRFKATVPERAEAERSDNPFSVLAKLKNTGDS